MKKAGSDFCLSQKQALKAANAVCTPLTSHQLAAKLLELPDMLVSSHEHGEICTGARVDKVAANLGLLKGIVIDYNG